MIDHLSLNRAQWRWKSLSHRKGSARSQKFRSSCWCLLRTVEIDTCYRLSSVINFCSLGPKLLSINGPWGASFTGVVRCMWLFVCSNPTWLKASLAACNFKLILCHLRACSRWKQNPATFVKCDLANWFWSGQFKMLEGQEHRVGQTCMFFRAAVQVVKRTCCCFPFLCSPVQIFNCKTKEV